MGFDSAFKGLNNITHAV